MAASNSSSQSKLYYSLKQKATAQDSPHFAQSEKVNGSWTTTNTYDTITGRINKLEIVEKDFGSGGKQNVFVLELQDDTDTMSIQMPHGNLTYSILNSLASDINKLSEYRISVYKKPKDDKFFAGCFIKCDNNQVKWLVDPKETPRGEKILKADGTPVMNSGKPMIDYEGQKKFWEEFAKNNLISKISAPAPSIKEQVVAQSTQNAVELDPNNDDLPF